MRLTAGELAQTVREQYGPPLAFLVVVVAVWDLGAGTLIHQLKGHQNWVTSVAVSPDGRRIVSGSRDHTVAV